MLALPVALCPHALPCALGSALRRPLVFALCSLSTTTYGMSVPVPSSAAAAPPSRLPRRAQTKPKKKEKKKDRRNGVLADAHALPLDNNNIDVRA